MTTWGEYRTEIREVILRDLQTDDTKRKWNDASLLACLKWAQRNFAQHTALPKLATYAAPDYDMATITAFPVPTDQFEPLDKSGLVYATPATTPGSRIYLDALNFDHELHRQIAQGFYVFPETTLNVLQAIGTGYTLNVQYYAYYGEPASKTDTEFVMQLPRWAEGLLTKLIAYYALSGQATKEVNIAQFKADGDKGQPEHAAIRSQIEFLWDSYISELATFTPQRRNTFHRKVE